MFLTLYYEGLRSWDGINEALMELSRTDYNRLTIENGNVFLTFVGHANYSVNRTQQKIMDMMDETRMEIILLRDELKVKGVEILKLRNEVVKLQAELQEKETERT